MREAANRPAPQSTSDSVTTPVSSSDLSAMGSRNAPNFDIWLKCRATQPSMPSLAAAVMKTPSAHQRSVSSGWPAFTVWP